jgi:hypothetical protein
MKIYSDSQRKREVHDTLLENETYYLDFNGFSSEQILEEINRSKLEGFISWQSGNRFATLKVTNYIGDLYFLGKNFDLKSKKFLPQLSGREQF